MNMEPCDIVVCKMPPTFWNKIETWALSSPFGHVLMYLGGSVMPGYPLIYESTGRGVNVRNIAAYFGREVVVVRPQLSEAQRQAVVKNALDIAFAYDSYYDYLAAGRLGLVLIFKKLGLPLPLAWHRDKVYICSEAVAEPFWRAGIPILPEDVEPAPADFLISPIVVKVAEGKLAADWV